MLSHRSHHQEKTGEVFECPQCPCVEDHWCNAPNRSVSPKRTSSSFFFSLWSETLKKKIPRENESLSILGSFSGEAWVDFVMKPLRGTGFLFSLSRGNENVPELKKNLLMKSYELAVTFRCFLYCCESSVLQFNLERLGWKNKSRFSQLFCWKERTTVNDWESLLVFGRYTVTSAENPTGYVGMNMLLV